MTDITVPEILSDKIVKRDPRSLVKWPGNPRRGDVEAIAESIRLNGFAGVIFVQKSSGWICKGNHTTDAAVLLGMPLVPVCEIDVDDATAKRILLADNRAADLGYYDNDELTAIIQDLSSGDVLEGSLYSSADLDALLASLGQHEGAERSNVHEGRTPAEREAEYAASTIRSVILPLNIADYERVVRGLAKLRSAEFGQSNAEVIVRLIDEAVGGLDDD